MPLLPSRELPADAGAGRKLDADLDDELRTTSRRYCPQSGTGLRPGNGTPECPEQAGGFDQREGRSPRRARRTPHGRHAQGHRICVADAAQSPRLYARGGDDAGARRRRQHGDLQRGACAVDCAAALSRTRRGSCSSGPINHRRLSSRAVLGARADGSRYALHALRRLWRNLGHHRGLTGEPNRSSSASASCPRTSFRTWRERRNRPHVHGER